MFMCYISSLWWHELLHPKTSRIYVNAMEPELLRTHSVPDPPLHVFSLTRLALSEFWTCTQLLPCGRASPHVLHSHMFDCFYQPVLLCLESFRFKLNLKCFFFFVLQPPPAITDKQLDEREHTVEEWKGGNYLCFYLCFLIKSDWHKSPCWTLLGQCFCSASSTFNLNYRIFWTKSRSGV